VLDVVLSFVNSMFLLRFVYRGVLDVVRYVVVSLTVTESYFFTVTVVKGNANPEAKAYGVLRDRCSD
jgi:hypothetical protein